VTDELGFQHYNPNFVKAFDDWDEAGQTEFRGYGIESNAIGIKDVQKIAQATDGQSPGRALETRQALLRKWTALNCRALPEVAMVGVAVNNAARMSFDNGGKYVYIDRDFNLRME
jgi:hypothetical protein